MELFDLEELARESLSAMLFFLACKVRLLAMFLLLTAPHQGFQAAVQLPSPRPCSLPCQAKLGSTTRFSEVKFTKNSFHLFKRLYF